MQCKNPHPQTLLKFQLGHCKEESKLWNCVLDFEWATVRWNQNSMVLCTILNEQIWEEIGLYNQTKKYWEIESKINENSCR